MRTATLIAACTLLISIQTAVGAEESLSPCDPMPVPLTRPIVDSVDRHRPADLYWSGTIVLSFTITTDGSIKHAQARISEEAPTRLYRFRRAIQIVESASPADRQRAEEDAREDALQMISTLRYPTRAVECQGEFSATFTLPSE